ncbi:M3 family metallopeptidase [Imbroritus primus]|uniref:M3 family metallopeptidase n=1 Tax=Imbroritus primus TaxID=3058603 RepID=A0ACD3SR34_9BURK|nr:M3 family metallopeptidase [Burkholderiaceae bacterium PBA]
MTPADNPLLDFSGLPRFDAIRPEHITPALDRLLADAQAAVQAIENDTAPATWDTVLTRLEAATEPLGRAWGIVSHLSAVVDTPALRQAHAENLPRVTEFSAALGQNLALYRKYKAIAEGPEFAGLSPARKMLLEHELRGFRLGGAELPEDQKARFAEIQEAQANLSKAFSDHVLDATNAYALFIEDEARLAGVPEDALEAARAAAEKDGKAGWKFTLHFPSYFPVLQYADDRTLRQTLYEANVTRASELTAYNQGKPEWDNSANMVEQLALRQEESRMLGYGNFGELSLVPKMAESPEQVLTFLRELADKARPFAEADWAELQTFARESLGLDKLEPWDLAYASEKLREQRYAFSEQEVKQYFPEPQVLAGLFDVVQTLFDVVIAVDEAPTWHPDVRFYRVSSRDGRLLAQFYIDLYAREGKRGGAWMDDARGRKRLGNGSVQTPVAYLTCNFSAPVGGRPALFTHDEVITLFHEFGHGLHHMLTQVEDLGVSGINGVEWDAVELPSQFMENFCWEWEVLSRMTRHATTGEPLPRALYDRMLAARNFQNGMMTLRQIVFSVTDMQLHTDFDPRGNQSVLELARTVNDTFHVIPQATLSRWPNSFSHIFAGGYAAGYYSYKWAEVLSADAYAAFEEAAQTRGTVLDPETGMRYRQAILEAGGSRPAMESFKAFRGRQPTIDALLRHGGMAA